MMKDNPIIKLEAFGQSVWMDFIRRGMISSGELRKLIQEDGVSGVTSNPSIFEKAIAESHDYDESISALIRKGKSNADIFERLSIEDIQNVAGLLRPIYDDTRGYDGFVSLEVSPALAYDTVGTIKEARRLWSLTNRPNVMIKVPATPEGIPAIQHLVGEGININITLLFGLPRYREVLNAYLAGLETQEARGRGLGRIASVASFFLSRIDVLVDGLLEKKALAGGPQAEIAGRLHGKAAIASAKAAYEIYKEVFSGDRFQKLAAKGARAQRLLWASTSTKNPAYSDTKYIEPLIGPETINTLPVETLNAYRDHGSPLSRLDQDQVEARQALKDLPSIGIDLDAVTRQLEQEGVEKFAAAFDRLIAAIHEKRAAVIASHS